MRILIIDNYDSFTYNLVQYLGELGAVCEVIRNDVKTVRELGALKPERILISPGPCTPNEAGVCLELIRTMAGQVPILGVCLGHQAIGQVFGGFVVRAPRLVHGKTSEIYHKNTGIFQNIPNPMIATRYHSLMIAPDSLPKELEVTAWADDGVDIPIIMGVRHRSLPIEGVQFHPESILTEFGKSLLANWLSST